MHDDVKLSMWKIFVHQLTLKIHQNYFFVVGFCYDTLKLLGYQHGMMNLQKILT